MDLAREGAAIGLESGLVTDESYRLAGDAPLETLTAEAFALGVFSIRSPRGPSSADAAALRGVENAIHAVRPDVIHGHGAKGGLYARLARRPSTTARVYTTHGGSLHYDWNRPGGAVFLAAEALLKARTDGLIFESDFVRSEYVRKLGSPNAPWRVIEHGVSPRTASDQAPVVDFVVLGELRALKGLETLLLALRKVKALGRTFNVRIYGDGPDAAAFRARAKALDLTHEVEWMGFTSDPFSALAEGRAVIVPSLRESFCYTALDALAVGRVLIASRTGVLRTLDEAELLLVEPGQPAALAERLTDFLDGPFAFETASAALARQLPDRWSARRMAQQTLAFYHEARAATRRR